MDGRIRGLVREGGENAVVIYMNEDGWWVMGSMRVAIKDGGDGR